MTKQDLPLDSGDYAPVADRIALFYQRHPTGRIVPRLISYEGGRVIMVAAVYRESDDARPAATGHASEREDDGDVNAVACLENTETSAIGRALANLGFTASRQRPSAEEMAKAARERARNGRRAAAGGAGAAAPARPAGRDRSVREPTASFISDEREARAAVLMDVLSLISAAEREGMRPRRAAALRERLSTVPPGLLDQIEARLRGWLANQRSRRGRI